MEPFWSQQIGHERGVPLACALIIVVGAFKLSTPDCHRTGLHYPYWVPKWHYWLTNLAKRSKCAQRALSGVNSLACQYDKTIERKNRRI